MWDVECPYAPPAILFEAAGLVDDPTVLMVKDEETGRWYRAPHVLEDFCHEKLQKDLSIGAEKAAEVEHLLATLYLLSAEELAAKIRGYGITAPGTKNALSDPHPCTLMVQDSIVPSGYLLE
ncbi:glycine--tRNA ligase, mitochondrial 1-like [Syzygium oleosum]|uniref:glycine--tRNA ligase, mitochondrial 1-like n=1 Tax=Syzygium oleosum TaxID=219896 RepID=UPI0024B8B539|nr:glycine--tRNA ligase, mitochondrial 1-like [Syzygium oleosum]